MSIHPLALTCLGFYLVMLAVAVVGLLTIATAFQQHKKKLVEPVTIIRPIKGIDPELESCLALSFLQHFPRDKLQVIFCVDSDADPALPVLEKLRRTFPETDCLILVLSSHFGPNPKVNNLAKGFLAAKHDLVWIMDLNVWAGPDVLAHLVRAMCKDENCGRRVSGRSVKLVHHVPLAILLDSGISGLSLDELFLFSSHSKFYVGLNQLSIAPCVNGKSNMYRRSDLDAAVKDISVKPLSFFLEPSVVRDAARVSLLGPGHLIQFFARYIGEDNMIGLALWHHCHGRMALSGDFVVQPLKSAENSVKSYFDRRVRWLRVRKYMVLLATLVEPTTESLVCGVLGTYAILTFLWGKRFSWPFFVFHMVCWCASDWWQCGLWSRAIAELQEKPAWLKKPKRSFSSWWPLWALRELFALPVWVVAMAGHDIEWRGKPFIIKKDLSAEEM